MSWRDMAEKKLQLEISAFISKSQQHFDGRNILEIISSMPRKHCSEKQVFHIYKYLLRCLKNTGWNTEQFHFFFLYISRNYLKIITYWQVSTK